MADFKKLEMAVGERHRSGFWLRRKTGDRRAVDGGGGCQRTFLTAAVVLSIGSVVMAGVCMWSQTQLKRENMDLKEGLEFLESKVQTVDVKVSEFVFPDVKSPSVKRNRRVRSPDANGDRRKTTRRPRDHHKAVHLQLDVGGNSHELRWRIWPGVNPSDTAATHFALDSIRLSDDQQSVTIHEAGLYLIYAQIQFENARPRNAFSIEVDNTVLVKCFQSLDYFNHSLTSTENARLKPCYSSVTAFLRRNQVVTLRNLYPTNRVFSDPLANYWGFVKLADN